jgi:transcriptional regulator with GAF, ATPase, and Fis domain
VNEDEIQTRLLDSAPKIALSSVELYVIAGPDRGLVRRLEPGRVRVGTAAGNHVILTDSTVSRLHCEIQVRPGGLRLLDLESTNGTFVNGVRVHDVELTPGSTVSVASTVLRLETVDEPTFVDVSPIDRFGDLIGHSIEMRLIYAVLDRVAPTNATILVQGETGTGKEAVARAIHEASRRADGPFVTVDCGAIAENLMESELFGHVRGAFSGAVQERKGLFEEADGGTLFLDEIGELPIALQPKLLRALELREIRRVGGNAARRVDVRVVAATNRSLAHAVNEGAFREDLYYRLAVLEVNLPPLRARREDISLLAQHFYERFAGSDARLPDSLLDAMMRRAWPGNVRELRNFVERSVSLGWSGGAGSRTSGEPPPAALEALVTTDVPLKVARARWTEQFEVLYVTALLRRTQGNVTRAAELAGVNRRSLQRLMLDHGIRSADGRMFDDEGEEGEEGSDQNRPR